MPKEGFADLWATIKAGHAWEAPVKNRTKNGDFYWVRANATPIVENGKVTGYISVRAKPSREEVAAASSLYEAIRMGRQGNLTLKGGRIIRTGLGARIGELSRSIGARVGATIGVLVLCLVAMTAIGLGASAETALTTMWISASLGFAFAGAMCLWLYASIKAPIGRLHKQLTAIAHGELGRPVPDDAIVEFRDISNIVRAMKAQLSFVTEENAELNRKAVDQRNKVLREMADTVEAQVEGAVGTVAGYTQNMSGNAREMAGAAQMVSENSQAVSAAATQMLANTQTVSSATEQLVASIREIAGQLDQTVTVSRATMSSSEATMQDIQKLSQVVDQISVITGVIREVAAQTNLLALNATIEAARAGEAGKGFAVVANEVKNLAAQTANSTAEIERTVGEVRAATNTSVASVNAIVEKIREVDTFATAIASAVEQQSAATSEIARNVGQAADAAKEVAERISLVATQAEKTGGQAQSVHALAGDVDNSIHDLRAAVVRAVRHVDSAVNRRKSERYNLAAEIEVEADGRRLRTKLIDISLGGARIAWPENQPAAKNIMLLLSPGMPRMRVTVKQQTDEFLRGQFELGGGEVEALTRFIEQAKSANRAVKVA